MATGRLPDPNSAPVTAKGDLYTYSTVPAKLAVGNNGETLVADSSASVGLRYQEPKTQNCIVNSNMSIWQRGTSFSVSGFSAYTADRWLFASGSNTGRTVSRQATGDSTNLPNIQYGIRVQRNSGNTSATTEYLDYTMETVDSIPLAGKTVTISFYAKRGANYSGSSNTLRLQLVTGTGTDQNVNSGFTGAATPIDQNATLTTTYQRFSYSATLSSTLTQIGLVFSYNSTGTAGANDWFEITGVQLEVGSVATAYRPYSATLAGELAACQRYFIQMTQQSGETGEVTLAMGMTTNGAATGGCICLNYGREMRTKPTITISNLKSSDQAGWTVDATLNSTSAARVGATINVTHAANGAQYRPEFLVFPSAFTSNAYLRLDAEL